jgi:hypothetical protein
MPLDPEIADLAGRDMQAHYRNEPRPNFLFDADGGERPFSLEEPCSQAIFEQFVNLYAENGGEVEPVPAGEAEAGEPAATCPQSEHRVQIVDPWERGIADVNCTIRLEDGREISGVSDEEGYIALPEDCNGEVEIMIEDQPFDVIEETPFYSNFDQQEGYTIDDEEDEHLNGQMVFRV